jgi:hypothetical protein
MTRLSKIEHTKIYSSNVVFLVIVKSGDQQLAAFDTGSISIGSAFDTGLVG